MKRPHTDDGEQGFSTAPSTPSPYVEHDPSKPMELNTRPDVLKTWDVVRALKELVYNAYDQDDDASVEFVGEDTCVIANEVQETRPGLTFRSYEYSPGSDLGEEVSSKRPRAVGFFGYGLKDAVAVLRRNEIEYEATCKLGRFVMGVSEQGKLLVSLRREGHTPGKVVTTIKGAAITPAVVEEAKQGHISYHLDRLELLQRKQAAKGSSELVGEIYLRKNPDDPSLKNAVFCHGVKYSLDNVSEPTLFVYNFYVACKDEFTSRDRDHLPWSWHSHLIKLCTNPGSSFYEHLLEHSKSHPKCWELNQQAIEKGMVKWNNTRRDEYNNALQLHQDHEVDRKSLLHRIENTRQQIRSKSRRDETHDQDHGADDDDDDDDDDDAVTKTLTLYEKKLNSLVTSLASTDEAMQSTSGILAKGAPPEIVFSTDPSCQKPNDRNVHVLIVKKTTVPHLPKIRSVEAYNLEEQSKAPNRDLFKVVEMVTSLLKAGDLPDWRVIVASEVDSNARWAWSEPDTRQLFLSPGKTEEHEQIIINAIDEIFSIAQNKHGLVDKLGGAVSLVRALIPKLPTSSQTSSLVPVSSSNPNATPEAFCPLFIADEWGTSKGGRVRVF